MAIGAVAGHAVALQIGDVLGQRRGAETRALVSDDTRLHHHAPSVGAQLDLDRRPSATSELRAAAALAGAEARADVAGLLRGAHHLADKGLRALGATVAGADAAGANLDVVVAGAHGRDASRNERRPRCGY